MVDGASQQDIEVDGLRLARLDAILEEFGMRLCRSAARSAASWQYDPRDAQWADDQVAFTLNELYILLETAIEIHA